MPRRAAFTLIELLVVLAIIGILFAIATSIYASSVGAARAAATRTTVLKINHAVMARRENFYRQNFRAAAQSLKSQYDSGGNPAPNATLPTELALLLVKKNQFRGAFPQRLEDLFGIDGTPGTVDDSPLWARWKRTCNANGLAVSDANIRPTGHRIDLENSELLLLFLTSPAYSSDDVFNTERIPSRHVTDANGNGLRELRDDWGNPLRFYNWPTRLIRPGGNGQPIDQSTFAVTARQFMPVIPPPPQPVPFPFIDDSDPDPDNWVGYMDHPLNNDVDDPFGSLPAAQDATGMLTAPFQINIAKYGSAPSIVTCPPFNEGNYHSRDTYHAPLVISAGPDGKLGLVEPTDATERRNADIDGLDATMDDVAL